MHYINDTVFYFVLLFFLQCLYTIGNVFIVLPLQVDLKVHRQIYANFLRQSKKRKLEVRNYEVITFFIQMYFQERERIDNELKILDKDLEAVAASTSESDTLNDSAQVLIPIH